MSVYDRIEQELRARRKSWIWLGEAMGGYSKGRMNNWKRRGVPSSVYPDIAHALGKTIDWVANGTDPDEAGLGSAGKKTVAEPKSYPLALGPQAFSQHRTTLTSATNSSTLVPEVVSWDQLGVVLSKQRSKGQMYDALAIPGLYSSNLQLMQYPDDSLEPDIRHGEWIMVEPGIEPWPGDVVIARGKSTGQHFAGRYVSNRSGGFKIRSNKPDRYADADHNEAEVVGVVTLKLSGRSGTPPPSL